MRILVTNDDGVDSAGLLALTTALAPLGELIVVAPATNQTAMSRSITLTPSIAVDEISLSDGTPAFAVEGTPCDCVRFALLAVEGGRPDIVVSGINRGTNLGDDVAYSGTVAAAFEGLLNGLPSIAVSQQAAGGRDWAADATFSYGAGAEFVARLVPLVIERGLPEGTLLNVNAPRARPIGVRIARLGRRIYHSSVELSAERLGRRHYRLYGAAPGYHHDADTDVAAIDEGYLTVTPLHYDITARRAFEHVEQWQLDVLVDRPP